MPPSEAGWEVLASAGDPAGWCLTVRLPAASPFFRGHFPAQAVFPGVAQLALVARALRDWRGEGAALAGVRGVKFRQTLGPGDTVAVRLVPGPAPGAAADGAVAFVLERGGEVVSRGTATVSTVTGHGTWR